MTVHLIPVRYPLTRVVHTSASTFVEREGTLVALESAGLFGWGEAVPVPGWFHGDAAGVADALDAWVEKTSDDEQSQLDTNGPLPQHPVAAAAIDCARLDLAGRRIGLPIHRLLNERLGAADVGEPVVKVNALIGAGSASDAANFSAQAAENGFEVIKVKVAADHISQDEARLDAIRRAVGPEMTLRIDANQGWTPQEAPDAIARLSEFDLEYVEEPCNSLNAIAKMREDCPIPIYLDEQVRTPGNAHQVIVSQFADGLVLKPATLGQLSTAVGLAERAHQAGMGVTITNVLDSGIGTLAAMHVAAAVEVPLNACGFATGDLFTHAPAPPPVVIAGTVRVPTTPGLGVTPELTSEFVAEDFSE